MSGSRVGSYNPDLQSAGGSDRVKLHVPCILAALAAIVLVGTVFLIVYQHLANVKLLDAHWIYAGMGVSGAMLATALFFIIARTLCVKSSEKKIDPQNPPHRPIHRETPPNSPRPGLDAKPTSPQSPLPDGNNLHAALPAPTTYKLEELVSLQLGISQFEAMPVAPTQYQIFDLIKEEYGIFDDMRGEVISFVYALKIGNDQKDCMYFKEREGRQAYIQQHLSGYKDAFLDEIGCQINSGSDYWEHQIDQTLRIVYQKDGELTSDFCSSWWQFKYPQSLGLINSCKNRLWEAGRYPTNEGRRLAEAHSSDKRSYKEADLLKSTHYLVENEYEAWDLFDPNYKKPEGLNTFNKKKSKPDHDPSDKSVFILCTQDLSGETRFLYFKRSFDRAKYIRIHNLMDGCLRYTNWRNSETTYHPQASTIYDNLCVKKSAFTSVIMISESLNKKETWIRTYDQKGARTEFMPSDQVVQTIVDRRFQSNSTSGLELEVSKLEDFLIEASKTSNSSTLKEWVELNSPMWQKLHPKEHA